MSTMLTPPAKVTSRDPSTLAPRPMPRVLQMATLREQGLSLDEIAAGFMVSRERVRQILSAHGGPNRKDAAHARRRHAEQLAGSRIDELLASWRGGADPARFADTHGLQPAACRSMIARFATEVDRAARSASMADARASATYSDQDIVQALRGVAARLGRVPTGRQYAAHARGTQLPSLATVFNRMGSWSTALTTAGLAPAIVDASSRPRWTDQACWEALRRAVDELGEVPSVLAYDRLAADRSDLPSSATIRTRLGRWSSLTARLAAQRELSYQVHVRVRAVELALANA